jgi:hypothetical protein
MSGNCQKRVIMNLLSYCKIELGISFQAEGASTAMENKQDKYIYLMNAGESLSMDDFDVEFYEYNSELCCDGNPQKTIKNFEELIDLLEEWEEN